MTAAVPLRRLPACLCLVLLAAAAAAGDAAPPPAIGAPAGDLAELPHWPIAMMLPPGVVPEKPAKKPSNVPVKAQLMAWVPPAMARVRALLLVPNNSDSKGFAEHAALRAVAARHGMAVVYMRQTLHYGMKDGADLGATQKALDLLAERTGLPGFRHAPWIVFGKSSTGAHPYFQAWAFPARTIATITFQGETPPWPPAAWAKPQDETIPHVNVNGELEWMGTWYRHVRPNLLNYRANSAWLPHQVVVAGVGHGNYPDVHGSPGWGNPVPAGTISVLRVWDYLALFVDKALALRLSADADPAQGAVTLRRIDPDAGVLVHPRAIEELLAVRWRPLRRSDGLYRIVDHVQEPHEVFDPEPGAIDRALLLRKAADVPAGERAGLLWLADQQLADAWLALHTVRSAAGSAPPPGLAR